MANKLYDSWNVQLAKTYEPGMLRPNEWFSVSQKVNGIRATFFAGSLVSRTGNEIVGFEYILQDIKKLEKCLGAHVALDGELRLREEFCKGLTDNEAFKVGTGIANSTRDMSNKYKLQFIIFDVLPAQDWIFDRSRLLYIERLSWLNEIKEIIEREGLQTLKIVPVMYSGRDADMIERCLIEANNNGWEGVMINRNVQYQYKRTNGILKYKSFNTIDLECIGMIEGTGKYVGMMGALRCKFGDNVVCVGTGFDDRLRKYLWDMGTWINGKIIEVKYKDITSDAVTGLESLQFPVFVQIKMDKTQADDIEAIRCSNLSDFNN